MSGTVSEPSQWKIGPISSPTLTWGAVRNGQPHVCVHCGILLLTGEKSGFCCGMGGSRLSDVPALPPLPPQLEALTLHPQISSLSHVLNLVFSFASLEMTHPFPDDNIVPGFLTIQGCVYHHVCPSHANLAICWLLYNGIRKFLMK
ncbi:hypothetical protein PISMIDRAFT_121716 [Pisolithus microcarpus 441]|uniref:Unplaced genomic scaffold scaffold_447, whole genome shotgun sequence n=1 Tax=Pisolithus microcarpus 441 TaxID=765257 RepID=A0A0C9Y4R8_9AGAM|nr:hypothetical protein BKA83DRAFT_4056852 [Pisolithus microcarpus]KIK11996.1 hypothetical protein PISMIDRAFT_121716 [Pisolithus microcarpus 441]